METAAGTYRADPGPTVLTMPALLEEAFGAVGEQLATGSTWSRWIPPTARDSPTAPRSTSTPTPTPWRPRSGGSAGRTPRRATGRLRTWLTQLYHAEIDRFIGANFDSPLGLLGPDLARLAALGGFGRLGPRVARYLPDERLQRIFSFQALYAGVPPDRALGAYGVIAYMDTVAGVYFPRGGMREVGRALAGAAADAGAEILYGRTVTGLERSGGRVTAVRHRAADGGPTERLACDAVVLTPDLPVVHRLLGRAPRRPVPLRWSPSAVVLHAGVTRARPELAHHTISFGAAWESTFREIIDEGRLMSDPSLLVTRPDGDRSRARSRRPGPAVRARPVPEHGGRPDRLAPGRARLPRRAAARAGGPRPRARRAGGRDRGVAAGHAGGLGGRRARARARRSRSRTRSRRPGRSGRATSCGADNVVLAGCGTTPGVGIPPVLISGRLAAERITGAGRGPRGRTSPLTTLVGALATT